VGSLLRWLHVLGLLIGGALGVLTILVVLGMDSILFTFHALVVVTSALKLIIIVFLRLLVLWRCLGPVVASTHVRGLHALDASLWSRRVLLIGSRLTRTCLIHLALLFGLLRVDLFTLEANLLAIVKISELCHAPVTDVHLVLWHVLRRWLQVARLY
jgi:hypothetical protein